MRRLCSGVVHCLLACAVFLPAACTAQTGASDAQHALVDGLKLGHHTLSERPTGCTVALAEEGAVGGVDVRGGSPGTREIALLDPVNRIQVVHAVVLSGGSAFGLDAASGVVRYLEERDIGVETRAGVVPIVVGAILFDLGVGGSVPRPGPDCGYRAAMAATEYGAGEGSVGAGAGATVGKLRGLERAMKGGVGIASIRRDDGLQVAAVVAVNAYGDVIDPATGRVVAGVRTPDGRSLADARALIRGSGGTDDGEAGTNTTIGLVATNAVLTKAEVTKVAQMAQDGLARAIYPSHTPGDGDAVFALATGRHEGQASVSLIGTLAADAMAEAILRAVRNASGLPGLPSVSELPSSR